MVRLYALHAGASPAAASSCSTPCMRLQNLLPLNPQGFDAVPPDLAFNTAVSFITNANWQAYGGETTMSHLTQMLGLTANNFLNSAVATALAIAVIRGIARGGSKTIGNFWVDLTRATLYLYLPLSIVVALALRRARRPADAAGRPSKRRRSKAPSRSFRSVRWRARRRSS